MSMDEKLKTITQLAEVLFTPAEIAKAIGCAEVDFLYYLTDSEHPFFKAYYPAYYGKLIELRKTILSQAISGSTPAQLNVISFIREIENQLPHVETS